MMNIPENSRVLYLSRRGNGLFMLTNLPPIRSEVGQTGKHELYISPGDMVGLNNLCIIGTIAMFGAEAAHMARLSCVRVWINSGAVGGDKVKLPSVASS